MALLLAPSGVSGAFKVPITGNTYTPDANSIINVVNNSDVAFLQSQGFFQLPLGRFNLTASADPGVSNDNTQDYLPGSFWINTTSSPNRAWMCAGNATGAAVWVQLGLGSSTGGSAAFAALTLTGLLNQSWTGGITAFASGGQASATALTTGANIVGTATSPAASVKLPTIASVSAANGAPWVLVINLAANALQVFGNGSDTVDGIAGATGVPLAVNAVGLWVPNAAAAWTNILANAVQTNYASNTAANTTSFTATAAQLTGGREVVLHLTGTLGSGQAITLPTMANVIAALPSPAIGFTWKLRIINESSANFAWTVTNNSWTTFTVANAAVGQNKFHEFLCTVLSATTLSIVAVGNNDTTQP